MSDRRLEGQLRHFRDESSSEYRSFHTCQKIVSPAAVNYDDLLQDFHFPANIDWSHTVDIRRLRNFLGPADEVPDGGHEICHAGWAMPEQELITGQKIGY